MILALPSSFPAAAQGKPWEPAPRNLTSTFRSSSFTSHYCLFLLLSCILALLIFPSPSYLSRILLLISCLLSATILSAFSSLLYICSSSIALHTYAFAQLSYPSLMHTLRILLHFFSYSMSNTASFAPLNIFSNYVLSYLVVRVKRRKKFFQNFESAFGQNFEKIF